MNNSQSPFEPHGLSRYEIQGQILILRSEGPFNVEHVRSTAAPIRAAAEQLRPQGPWASVNIIQVNCMGTPEAFEAMRQSAQYTRDVLGRVAAAYVMGSEVEGRGLMIPLLRQACADVIPVAFFHEAEPAMQWANAQIAVARAAPDPLPDR